MVINYGYYCYGYAELYVRSKPWGVLWHSLLIELAKLRCVDQAGLRSDIQFRIAEALASHKIEPQ